MAENSKLSSSVSNIPKRHEDRNFDNYKINSDNEKQFNICKNWDSKESMTLTGKTGTGKTHLAIAMLKNMQMILMPENYIHEEKYKLEIYIEREKDEDRKNYYKNLLDTGIYKYRKAVCLFVPFVEMFVEINTAAMEDKGKRSVLDKYAKNYDCICFDDLGAERLTDAKRENLYYIIDSRYREMLPTIITSNFTIQEISDVEPRIASRFAEMGKIVQFNGQDYRKQN